MAHFDVIQYDFDATGNQLDSYDIDTFDTEAEADEKIATIYRSDACREETRSDFTVLVWDNGSYSRWAVNAY